MGFIQNVELLRRKQRWALIILLARQPNSQGRQHGPGLDEGRQGFPEGRPAESVRSGFDSKTLLLKE